MTIRKVKAERIAVWAVLVTGMGVAAWLAPLASVSSKPAVESETATTEQASGTVATVDTRKKLIDAEVQRLPGHPWAGEYYEGDGLGANITISLSPMAGVAANWQGCLGLYGANAGLIEQAPNGNLAFKFSEPNPKGFGGFPEAVTPVRWGARRYLVPPSRMLAFVNAINHGREPRTGSHGLFLLARGDETLPALGLPQIPDEYLASLRSKPLEVSVTKVEVLPDYRVEDYCEKRYRLTIDHGSEDGLVVGVELEGKPPADRNALLRIVDADIGSAVGEISVYEQNCTKPKNVPGRHWSYTTGAYTAAVGR